MRNPPNDTGRLGQQTDDGGPVRRCILSGERGAREALIRLALSPEGEVLPDVRAKAPGRGAWIGIDAAALDGAVAKGRLRGALSRAFKTGAIAVPDDLSQRIAAALERGALDRLGMEARAGTLLTGADRIEGAARSGRLFALYHAADAQADGMRKLAQAWRVGENREGSDLTGLALPVPRSILSLALGRENVVHIGLTDRAAAERVGNALNRWLRFTGPDLSSLPCEINPQGAVSAGPFEATGRSGTPRASGESPGRDMHEEFE